MRRILIFILLFSFGLLELKAQISKGEAGIFALTNARINTITNGIIERGTLIITDGKIAEVGTTVTIPEGAKVIDCSGHEIYPGFIDSGTRLGLTEVGSDQRTRDYNEIGEVIPHMLALTAVNPNSALIPVTRISGVTTVLTMPSGGIFPGTAALIDLHGYTPEQMYAGFSGVLLNFPTSGRRGWWDRRTDEELEKATKEALEQLDKVWESAVQYYKTDSVIKTGDNTVKLGYYPEMEALMPVVMKEAPVLIEVNKAADIKAALKWIEDKNINVVLTGVAEGHRVAKEIAEANVAVITGPVLSTPSRDYDRYDKPYANAGILKKAGVKVALRTMEAENVRNLLYNAGFAVAYGMSKEDALRAITIEPAEIFNVADARGSIEKGKDATLFVASGDPFETSTDVLHVFIQGWKIPMESRHTQLYDEFLKREPGLEE